MPDPRADLARLSPFDRLADSERARVANETSPTQYAPGETILDRWQVPEYFRVVVEGVVEELDSFGPVGRYATGQGFDTRALIEGRSQHRFVARGPCTCFLIPAPLVQTLIRTDRRFGDFFREDVSRRLEDLVAVQQQREAASLLTARIGERGLRPPIFAEAETSIRHAVSLMKEHGTSAILVRQGERTGIFTGRDVRERSVLMGVPDTAPIGDFASYGLITLEKDELLFTALVTMIRHDIRHVVVTEGHRIVGVLEQVDLLSHLSHTSHVLANQIELAQSTDDLKDVSDSIPRLLRSLHDRGVKSRYIARLVTDLNRKMLARVYERNATPELLADACLVVMGSEGRGEQLLRTDQDNGIMFRGANPPAGFAKVTAELPRTLAELGYPPCPGNVMVSNPAWAKSVDAYRDDLRRWIHEPSAEGFMNLAILFDASAVAGDAGLLEDVKAYLFRLISGQANIVRHFARAIEAFETPIGLFNRFKLDRGPQHKGELDIKKGGVFPIVHGVRSLALEYRLTETNTISRIQMMSGRPPLTGGVTADLIEAFEFISMIQLRVRLDKWERGEATDNYVNPAHLTKLERGLLRDSLRLVKQFKSMVGNHFNITMIS